MLNADVKAILPLTDRCRELVITVPYQADVIVNTTSRDLDLSSAGTVSQSILTAAGAGIQAECNKVGKCSVFFMQLRASCCDPQLFFTALGTPPIVDGTM